jgi:hypothetical protein
MYSQEQVEKLLALHSGLVREGLDPDYAELRVLRLASIIDDVDVRATATEIAEGAEDRWKQPAPESSEPAGNYFDNLRRQLEAERASKRTDNQKAHERLERLR